MYYWPNEIHPDSVVNALGVLHIYSYNLLHIIFEKCSILYNINEYIGRLIVLFCLIFFLVVPTIDLIIFNLPYRYCEQVMHIPSHTRVLVVHKRFTLLIRSITLSVVQLILPLRIKEFLIRGASIEEENNFHSMSTQRIA